MIKYGVILLPRPVHMLVAFTQQIKYFFTLSIFQEMVLWKGLEYFSSVIQAQVLKI